MLLTGILKVTMADGLEIPEFNIKLLYIILTADDLEPKELNDLLSSSDLPRLLSIFTDGIWIPSTGFLILRTGNESLLDNTGAFAGNLDAL